MHVSRLAVLVVTVSAFAYAPTEIRVQTDAPAPPGSFCGEYFLSNCDFGWHKLLGPGPGWDNPHSDCAICMQGVCHAECFAASSRMSDAHQAARIAADDGDAEALVALATELGDYITYNPEREAIQLWDCERSGIIASLPLRPERIAVR